MVAPAMKQIVGDVSVKPITDHLVEVRFEQNLKAIDKRGHWAHELRAATGLDQVRLVEGRFDLVSEDSSEVAFISHFNAGYVMKDGTDGSFCEKLAAMFRKLYVLPGFIEGNRGQLQIKRIGVRTKRIEPTDLGFEELLDRVRDRYVGRSAPAFSFYGEAKLIDIAAPYNFEDAKGKFNTALGPMLAEQAITIFERDDEQIIPDPGLYYEIDRYSLPDRRMSSDELIGTLRDFVLDNSDKWAKVRALILDQS